MRPGNRGDRRQGAVLEEALPLGRDGPVDVLGSESEDGGEKAPGLAEDGEPARQGDVIPTHRAKHGNVPDVEASGLAHPHPRHRPPRGPCGWARKHFKARVLV